METEIQSLLVQQGEAFEAFKSRYDAELADERKEREALEMRIARGGIATSDKIETKAVASERKAIGAFIRSGDETELKT